MSAADPTLAAILEERRRREEAEARCGLDLLRSARLYFADGHPTRDAIDRFLADAPAPQPAPLAEACLSRESFLRHLHSLADATPSTEELLPSEVALSEHDAKMREAIARLDPRSPREETEPIHRLLTKRGVPAQIPPFKVARASLFVRVLAALTERDAARAALSIRNTAVEQMGHALSRYEPYPRCEYENSCDDSGRDPACRPCEARSALAAADHFRAALSAAAKGEGGAE